MHRLLLFFIAIGCISATLYNSCIRRTKGFSVTKITSLYPYEKKWQTHEHVPSEIISQPYTYLGSGKQTYAFVSQDGKYVLKLFKQKHMRKAWWQSKTTNRRHEKLREKTFTSYQLAFAHLKEETGLLYLHLTKTRNLHTALHLTDNKNERFTIDLDNTEFLIQKRADPIFSSIESLSSDDAKKAISSIVHLIKKRHENGLSDHDINCEKNFGLIGTTAIEIDLGEFGYQDPNKEYDITQELQAGTQDLHDWLLVKDLELAKHLRKEIGI